MVSVFMDKHRYSGHPEHFFYQLLFRSLKDYLNKMPVFALIFVLLALAAPSFQQPFRDIIRENNNCYNRCYSAYQKNPSNYLVNGCICSQYQFTGVDPNGRNMCGYLDNTCLANLGDYDAVFAYTFDQTSQRCQKVSVYNRCVGSYGVSTNIFQTMQECSRSCEFINRRY